MLMEILQNGRIHAYFGPIALLHFESGLGIAVLQYAWNGEIPLTSCLADFTYSHHLLSNDK